MCVMKVKDFTEETLDQIKEALTYRSDIDNYFSNFEWEEELSEKYKSRVDALDTFRKNLISDQENAKKDIEGREERVIALDSEIGATMDNACLELDDLISVLKELNQTIDSKGNFNANYDGTALRENINNIFNAKEIAKKLEEERLQKEKELEEERISLKSAAEQLGIENFDSTDPSQVSFLLNAIDNYNRTHAGSEIGYFVTNETRQKIENLRAEIAEKGDMYSNYPNVYPTYWPGYRGRAEDKGNHNGLDIAGFTPNGYGNAPITSVWQGTVVQTSYDKYRGYYVTIRTYDNKGRPVFVRLQHLQSPSNFSVGDSVIPGSNLGNTGETGDSKGIHMHIEVRPDTGTTFENSYYAYEGSDYPVRNPDEYYNVSDVLGEKYERPDKK